MGICLTGVIYGSALFWVLISLAYAASGVFILMTIRSRMSKNTQCGVLSESQKDVIYTAVQLDEIRQTDSQTTRWPGVVHLRPFSYDDQFLSLLATLDECLPMPEHANLASPEISLKIHQSCCGNFRLLKMLLAEAVRVASQVSAACITLPHLATAHFLVHCMEETPFGRI